MIGFIVKHSGFGYGRILSFNNGQFSVRFFFPPRTVVLVAVVNSRPVLKRALLPQHTVFTTPNGRCRITNAIPAVRNIEPHRYTVEFENGLAQELPETVIEALEEGPPPGSPLEALSEGQLEGYLIFHKREAFAEALGASVRGASGLRALLSSRIDLRPHQAYVAGTVLMDRLHRYLLADEVGLGKTIEAGIVIHELLERKPNARILILCPATLTQQWLSELYSKFSGRIFHMLELRDRALQAGEVPAKAISSYSAALKYSARLQGMNWDLVVVDEAHHLLSAPQLFHIAQTLSKASPSFLLLSAIPAQHREEEYLRLLSLLEPGRYQPNDPNVKEHFKHLYIRQIELGRKLSYIARRLEDFVNGNERPDRILQKLRDLASLPVLVLDEFLVASVEALEPTSPGFVEQVRGLLHRIGDRYRISRRILRNRRSQLLDAEPDLNIVRVLHRVPFEAHQLELDAANAARRYLKALKEKQVPDSILLPLARCLFHSLCDPVCLWSFLELATGAEPELGSLLEFDGHIAYQGWEEFASALWCSMDPRLGRVEFQDLQRTALAWKSGIDKSDRLDALVRFLRQRHHQQPEQKLLIFAGFFGLCPRLGKALVEEFGAPSVACFGWEMEARLKEKSVTRFKRDSQCWLLVSDETGGEGRNFQFADELVHFDLPWHVSKIEQRIGRLDRLGRTRPEVCSNVLYASGGEDDGLLSCLVSGFEVFSRSISGLEFALSNLERMIVIAAVNEGAEGLASAVGEVKAKSEQERADDEVQGLLDAASLERTSAEVYRRAQSTPERDQALELAFCDYLRFIGSNDALAFMQAADYPERSIVKFRPGQVPDGTVVMRPDANGAHPDRVGTFRREIAQERPDLEFFSVGNEFFDAVCATLVNSTKGRTYAVECHSPHPVWRGFEFSYRAIGNPLLLDKHPGLVKHLDRVMAFRTEHIFVGEDAQLAGNATTLLAIRRSFTKEGHNLTWFNFTLQNTRAQLLADYYAQSRWENLVAQMEGVARKQARVHFAAVLSDVIRTEFARIEEQIRQATIANADGWEDEVAGLEALRAAITGWDVELDIAGFLSINGGIIP
jgi:ATP-dependent helicase HepA